MFAFRNIRDMSVYLVYNDTLIRPVYLTVLVSSDRPLELCQNHVLFTWTAPKSRAVHVDSTKCSRGQHHNHVHVDSTTITRCSREYHVDVANSTRQPHAASTRCVCSTRPSRRAPGRDPVTLGPVLREHEDDVILTTMV